MICSLFLIDFDYFSDFFSSCQKKKNGTTIFGIHSALITRRRERTDTIEEKIHTLALFIMAKKNTKTRSATTTILYSCLKCYLVDKTYVLNHFSL